MARETFVDTSGFYALLVTTDYVLDETATLIKAKGHGHLLKVFFDKLNVSEAIQIEWTDKNRFAKTTEFFFRHAGHPYSFTDCVSFVVMRELGLSEALSKDKHFKEAGFKALLLD